MPAASTTASDAGVSLEMRAIAGPAARTIPLRPPGPVSVGRLPLCDAVLDDAAVSRRHATFMYRDRSWYVA
ncbi:MAG: FHA domain-containing protein, partial [Phycisphaerales bacterium]|nr:FHA domain-containing protein [Phycisphaerales bacterium]